MSSCHPLCSEEYQTWLLSKERSSRPVRSPTHLLVFKVRKMPTEVPLNRKSHRPGCSNSLSSSPNIQSRVSGSPGHVHPRWLGHPIARHPLQPRPLCSSDKDPCGALSSPPLLSWTGMAPCSAPCAGPSFKLGPWARSPTPQL